MPISNPAADSLSDRRQDRLQQLAALGDLRPRSLVPAFRKCGRANCRSAAPNHPGLGRRWALTHSVRGKARTRDQLDAKRAQIAECKTRPWNSPASRLPGASAHYAGRSPKTFTSPCPDRSCCGAPISSIAEQLRRLRPRLLPARPAARSSRACCAGPLWPPHCATLPKPASCPASWPDAATMSLCPIGSEWFGAERNSPDFSKKRRYWPCQHAFRRDRIAAAPRVLVLALRRHAGGPAGARRLPQSRGPPGQGAGLRAYPGRVGCGMCRVRSEAPSWCPKGEP